MALRLRSELGGLRPDPGIVAVFLASRILLLLAAIAAEYFIVRNPALTSGDGAPILRSLTSWDGWYYLGIVRDGYHAQPIAGEYRDVAFLPLYPLLIRGLSLPWPAVSGLVAVLISNLSFLLALHLLVRLGQRHIGLRRARTAAMLLAVYPFASAFGMAYTESLFLVFVLGAFLAAENDRRLWAGLLLGLAVLTRLQGIVLLLPLCLILMRSDGWRPRRSQAWLLFGPAAALLWLGFVAMLSGSPTGYLDAQQAWGRGGVGSSGPETSLASMISPYQIALLATLCWSVFMLVWVRRDRLRIEYALVPILVLAAVMASGTLESVGRYTTVAFPFVWLLARRRSSFARRGWPVISAGLYTLIALLTFGGYWVP